MGWIDAKPLRCVKLSFAFFVKITTLCLLNISDGHSGIINFPKSARHHTDRQNNWQCDENRLGRMNFLLFITQHQASINIMEHKTSNPLIMNLWIKTLQFDSYISRGNRLSLINKYEIILTKP